MHSKLPWDYHIGQDYVEVRSADDTLVFQYPISEDGDADDAIWICNLANQTLEAKKL